MFWLDFCFILSCILKNILSLFFPKSHHYYSVTSYHHQHKQQQHYAAQPLSSHNFIYSNPFIHSFLHKDRKFQSNPWEIRFLVIFFSNLCMNTSFSWKFTWCTAFCEGKLLGARRVKKKKKVQTDWPYIMNSGILQSHHTHMEVQHTHRH